MSNNIKRIKGLRCKNIQILLEQIELESSKLENHSFLIALKSKEIPVENKIAMYPHIAPIVMGFQDVLKFKLKKESNSYLQSLVNKHVKEESNHFKWYFGDLKTLGYDLNSNSSDFYLEVYRDEFFPLRSMMPYIHFSLPDTLSPEGKIIILETIEATANLMFGNMFPIAKEFEKKTGTVLDFFGDVHIRAEQSHTMPEPSILLQDNTIENEEYYLLKNLIREVFFNLNKVFRQFEKLVRNNKTNIQVAGNKET